MTTPEGHSINKNINYHNVAKVLERIFQKWDVNNENSAALIGLSQSELKSLTIRGTNIEPDTQKRMAYLLNIHELLSNLFEDSHNRKIFISPSIKRAYLEQQPMEFMI